MIVPESTSQVERVNNIQLLNPLDQKSPVEIEPVLGLPQQSIDDDKDIMIADENNMVSTVRQSLL